MQLKTDDIDEWLKVRCSHDEHLCVWVQPGFIGREYISQCLTVISVHLLSEWRWLLSLRCQRCSPAGDGPLELTAQPWLCKAPSSYRITTMLTARVGPWEEYKSQCCKWYEAHGGQRSDQTRPFLCGVWMFSPSSPGVTASFYLWRRASMVT